jgi:PAS domain S-box-containing protein
MVDTDGARSPDAEFATAADAERALLAIAASFASSRHPSRPPPLPSIADGSSAPPFDSRGVEPMYKVLVEQLPAIVYMAYLNRGIGDAYISPQLEEALGFTREEWLDDPLRWYQSIHPDDRARWSQEAAAFLTTGGPLKSAYRVIARDGSVRWFQCDARVVRAIDGQPWFIHGVAFDVTQEKRAEQRLLDSLREKETLLHEVHHRVKNNLAVIASLFYLQSSYTTDERTLKILQECQDRVRSMALVHELLYGSHVFSKLSFSDYAVVLARQLMQTHAPPNAPVRLRTELQPLDIDIARAVPCGLALNEMLTNALTHAFSDGTGGEVVLAIEAAPSGQCAVVVRDDGAGLPPDFDPDAVETLGIRLMRMLARQLDGTLTLRGLSRGTEVRLEFVVPAAPLPSEGALTE